MSDYEDKLHKILHDAWPDIDKNYALSFKKVFGAMAGYVNEHIFCTCGNFGFALKLPSEDVGILLKKGAQPLKYFSNGHVKKDYAVLSDSMINERKTLCRLIETSIKFSTNSKRKTKP